MGIMRNHETVAENKGRKGLMPGSRADGLLIHLVGTTFIRGVVWTIRTVSNLIKYNSGLFRWTLQWGSALYQLTHTLLPTSLMMKHITAYYWDYVPVNSGSYYLVSILHHHLLSQDFSLIWSI